jgi:hypothetical protein
MAASTFAGAVYWLELVSCPSVANQASTILESLTTDAGGYSPVPYTFNVAIRNSAFFASLEGADKRDPVADTV